MRKRLISILASLATILGLSVFFASPAQAALQCYQFSSTCTQQVTTSVAYNDQAGHALAWPITTNSDTGSILYLNRGTTTYTNCDGSGHGLKQYYLKQYYDMVITYWSDNTNSWVTSRFTATGFHEFPAAFKSPKCTLRDGKHGIIKNMYQLPEGDKW